MFWSVLNVLSPRSNSEKIVAMKIKKQNIALFLNFLLFGSFVGQKKTKERKQRCNKTGEIGHVPRDESEVCAFSTSLMGNPDSD